MSPHLIMHTNVTTKVVTLQNYIRHIRTNTSSWTLKESPQTRSDYNHCAHTWPDEYSDAEHS